MRSQMDRDTQTVTIASAIGLFLLVLAVGWFAVLLLSWLVDPIEKFGQGLAVVVFVAAMALSGRYLLRNRQP